MKCLLLWVLVASPSLIAFEGSQSPVALSLGVKADLVSGEPLLVNASLTNRTDGPIDLDLGRNRLDRWLVTSVGPNGQVTQLKPPPPPPTGGVARIGKVTIPAGETLNLSLLLSEWHSFAAPGEYDISITLPGLAVVKPASAGVSVSESLTVRVAPADPARLAAVCRELASAAVRTMASEPRSLATRALVTVREPICIPHIRQLLLATDWDDFIVLNGLAAMGTDEAQVLLTEMARSSNEHRSVLAKDALRRFGIKMQ